VIGCAFAVWFGVFALGRISHMSAISGPIGRLGEIARRFSGEKRS
jgi:hypothetical protein